MIFNTLENDLRYNAFKSDYIVIKVSLPRKALEKAIQEVLQTS